eukprot:Gregarina_sp_Poly_1__2678@NODE_1734_length_3443_cov_48_343009_g1135_i0_p1_GENE_NODE_1734_length_3443_cov_48_343009_g1135_i0NODE_1734_length_3443_cov_48_343009_g1135_i0_p1_ORF_typecomplete_len1032_score163_39DWNN/PF08783_11/6_6e06zfRING_6/PF14835_6/0_00025Siva/PF05458_12/0_0043zfRING_10/PF16685_5/0_0029FYVE_2/PF02318_16/0_0076Baculo_IE1/PF05290_11/0_06Bse634I/PF07832_11/0_12DZR/PF12773_7/67DZR/PF12773_7/10Ubox/PF04564_15/1_4Ubox/PF04564_15/1_2e03FAM76/PF16046_5/2_2zfC3HC4_2/PF13923_6/2_2C1_1/PF00
MDGRISFRSSYETESHVRYLETSGNALSVAEAKVAIAKALGLERDFARKFDLKLLNVANGNKPLDDDSELILPGDSLIVQRTLWRPVDEVKHEAQPFVQQWVHGQETTTQPRQAKEVSSVKTPLPKRYLCAHCGQMLDNPMTVRCENSCSASVCKRCAGQLLAHSTPALCPSCHQPAVKSFIPNRTLASIIAKTDFSVFQLPPNIHKSKVALKREELTTSAAGDFPVTAGDGATTQATAESPGYLFFVRPEQIQTVHSESVLILPAGIEELNKDTSSSATSIAAYVFALGGGGTSLITPGTAIIKEIIFVGVSKPDGQWSGCTRASEHPRPSNGAFSSVVASWFEWMASVPSSYVICKLDWEVKFQTVLLLPGKAQPIAGIRAGASAKSKYGQAVEIIKLNQSQKQGVSGRLAQEALFARMNRPNQPDLGRLPVGQKPIPQDSTSVVPPSGAAVSGDYVFDATANAWMTVERLNRKRHERVEGEKSNQWQIASQLRACFCSTSLFSNIQSQDSISHWSLINPLLPYIGQLPELNEQSFKAIQSLQLIALKRLVASKKVSVDLLQGLHEVTADVFKTRTESASKHVDLPTPVPVIVAGSVLPATGSTSSLDPQPTGIPAQNTVQRTPAPRIRHQNQAYPPQESRTPSVQRVPTRSNEQAHLIPNMNPNKRIRQFPPTGMNPQHFPPQWIASQQPHRQPQQETLTPPVQRSRLLMYPGSVPDQTQHIMMEMNPNKRVRHYPPAGMNNQYYPPHWIPPQQQLQQSPLPFAQLPQVMMASHPQSSAASFPSNKAPYMLVVDRLHYVDSRESQHSVEPTEFYSGKESMKTMQRNVEPVLPKPSDHRKQELLSKSLSSFQRRESRTDSGISNRRRSPDVKGTDPPSKRRRHHEGPAATDSVPSVDRRVADAGVTRDPGARAAPRRNSRNSEIRRISPPMPATTSRRRRQSLERRQPLREADARQAAARLFNASLPSQSYTDGQRHKRFDTHARRRVSHAPEETSTSPLGRAPSSKSEQSSNLASSHTRKRPKNSLFT